jgi:hypothetical protein
LPHAPLVDCLDAQKQVLIDLLFKIADHSDCKGCGAKVFWLTHKNGKKAPYTEAGLNHFADCPAADRFKKAAP